MYRTFSNRFWAFVHNAIIHPLLVLPESKWVDRAHAWTAHKAWPKNGK